MSAQKRSSPKKARSRPVHHKIVIPPESSQAPIISPPTPPVVIPSQEVTPIPPPQIVSPSPVSENSQVLVSVPDVTPSHQVQQLASLPTETGPISSLTNTPIPPPSIPLTMSKSKSKLPWMILLVVLLAGLGVASWAVSTSRIASKPITSSGLQPTSAQALPTSVLSPTPSLNRSEITIQVLNGSGTPGAASVAKAKLESVGYESVDTGNADTYDFNTVEISLKSSKAEFFNLLVSDLGDGYSVASTAGTLSSSSPYDAVITIGQQ